MRRQLLIRSILLFVAVGAFGVVDAIVKGHHGGVRNAVGSVSAPWAILPLFAGAFIKPRRLVLGALAGTATPLLALASYSLVRGGGSHLMAQGGLTSAAGNRWFVLGLVGGLVLGAASSWLASRGWWGLLIAAVAGLLVFEPGARMLWAMTRNDPLGTFVPSPGVWIVESLSGCALVVGCLGLRRTWFH